MKEHNEQLDLIEEVLQQLIQRIGIMDEKLNQLTNTKPPEQQDNSQQLPHEFAELKKDFDRLAEQILHPVRQISERAASIPYQIPVKHHHHFDLRSKGFIIGAALLLIITAGTAGLSLSLWSENRLLHANALEFRMVRLVTPQTALWVDSVYYHNPEKARQIIEQYEVREEALQRAGITAQHKSRKTKQTKHKVKR